MNKQPSVLAPKAEVQPVPLRRATMKPMPRRRLVNALMTVAAMAAVTACGGGSGGGGTDAASTEAAQKALVEQGKQIFRFDTFGDEAQWTDKLRMHEVIASSVDPLTAFSVGLKVDADALPEAVANGIRNGTIDLKSPATTVALLKHTRSSASRGRSRRSTG
ncbi:hypothetical protein [Cupriavidus necator]|uniref:hypothetical protein n=1 Tax=Cupriavidus necator TaxID=106590 RepID=UPI002783E7BB|nr:hypothetical protein [Cupriavidus necator]MDQ0141261.1 hypothetical protein [Cupriavidus necator]